MEKKQQYVATETSLIACHDCDLIQRRLRLNDGETARCLRCGAVLYEQKRNSLDRTIMLTLAGLILFVLANVFPFMTLQVEGRSQENTLITGVQALYAEGMWGLAILVFGLSILAPLLKLLGMLYLLLPLKFNRRPWNLAPTFRFVQALAPWGMLEVYMLGVLVAVVKIAQLATLIPGIAMYSFAVLIVITAAANAAFDPRIVWDRVEVSR